MQLHLRPEMENAMDEKGTELLAKTAQLFLRFGIKSMTMDDIARQLGVSKKTLYLYVSDKNDLVEKVMEAIVENEKQVARELCDAYENAIDMLFALSKDISQKFGQVHPSIHYDMQKYHPRAWQIFEAFRTVFIAECVCENLEKGIAQGLYRDNMDPFIISRLYAGKIEMCTDAEMFPPDRYDFKTIHLEMMRYHIRGIASEKGLAYLREKVQKEKYQL